MLMSCDHLSAFVLCRVDCVNVASPMNTIMIKDCKTFSLLVTQSEKMFVKFGRYTTDSV